MTSRHNDCVQLVGNIASRRQDCEDKARESDKMCLDELRDCRAWVLRSRQRVIHLLHVVVLLELVDQLQHFGGLRFGQLGRREADVFVLG